MDTMVTASQIFVIIPRSLRNNVLNLVGVLSRCILSRPVSLYELFLSILIIRLYNETKQERNPAVLVPYYQLFVNFQSGSFSISIVFHVKLPITQFAFQSSELYTKISLHMLIRLANILAHFKFQRRQ